jgi:hypothetical protein
MAANGRRRFLRVSDWHDFLNDVQQQGGGEVNLYHLRQQCYQDIEKLRQRPLMVYYVQFPGPPSPISPPISIDLDDVDGFTDLTESITDGLEVDVLIHSPGGSPEATERVVALLRERFDHITFLIPHSAYSAATMMALSGNEIIMHPSASLGPIDPQINGTPARALRRGFDKAREALKDEGPESLPAYIPLIEKYSLELLEICEDYERLSKELVTIWLTEYMFGSKQAEEIVENAVEFFASYDEHKTHSRSLTYSRVNHLGLNISLADGELRSLLREAHILLSGFFSVTPFIKLYENSDGLSWGRQFQIIPQPQPQTATKPK